MHMNNQTDRVPLLEHHRVSDKEQQQISQTNHYLYQSSQTQKQKKEVEQLLQPQGITFLKVILKPGVTKCNFMAYLLSNAASLTLLMSLSILLVLLIQDKNYFNISAQESGEIVATLIFVAEIFSIVGSQIIGVLYDIVGRRIILVISPIIGGVSLVVMPYCTEIFPWIMLTRVFAGIALLSIFGNPLLIDYVHQKTKGLAAAISGLFGGVTGVFIAVIEFNIASRVKLEYIFIFNGIFVSSIGILFFFIVENKYPSYQKMNKRTLHANNADKQDINEQLDQEKQTICQKISQNLRLIREQGFKKKEICLCFVANLVIKMIDLLIGSLSTLWYGQWVFQQDTQETTKFINSYYGLASIFAVILSFVFGVISDKISFKKVIAPLYIVISLMNLPIYYGDCMTCLWMIIMMGANASFTIAGNIVLIQLIARSIKGEGRGTIMGTFHLFGSFGILSFSWMGGLIIQSEKYNKMIYLAGSMFALIIGVLSWLMFHCGKEKEKIALRNKDSNMENDIYIKEEVMV